MTNAEAKKIIKSRCYFASVLPDTKEALDMAIEALSVEPQGDLISREEVNNIIEKFFEEEQPYSQFWKWKNELKTKVNELSTVEAVPLSVIEKIKAEIEKRKSACKFNSAVTTSSERNAMYKAYVEAFKEVLNIIDQAIKECDTNE